MAEPVYEFEGVIYESSGEFLDTLAHAYKTGDSDLVVQALEDNGFDLSDINVRPDGA